MRVWPNLAGEGSSLPQGAIRKRSSMLCPVCPTKLRLCLVFSLQKDPLLPNRMKAQMPKVAYPLAGGGMDICKLGAKAFQVETRLKEQMFLVKKIAASSTI